MQTLTELNEKFGVPGVLEFVAGKGGFAEAKVTTPSCTGAVYLYGAHLTAWEPKGAGQLIFVSEKSLFEAGKAIRGGIPLIFPWFGGRQDGPGPAHGFARTEVWTVALAAQIGDALHLTMVLGPNETSRALGFDKFRVAMEFVFGKQLHVRMSVANEDEKALKFEQGFHTYFAVSDIEHVGIHGLKDTEYLDKVDGFKRKTQTEDVLRFTGHVDRPYVNTEADVTLDDEGLKRKIVMQKKGSKTTVVWNPWAEASAAMSDLGAQEWRNFVCIECVNAGENAVTLAPQQAHTMEAVYTVESL